VIVDFKKPHLCPLFNEASHLVYAVKGSDVETVIVNGKIVMEEMRLTTVDVERVMENAEKAKRILLEKLDANVK
jgi:5-methylthioadenosine/S-adenosylhomocysteine deaminase